MTGHGRDGSPPGKLMRPVLTRPFSDTIAFKRASFMLH